MALSIGRTSADSLLGVTPNHVVDDAPANARDILYLPSVAFEQWKVFLGGLATFEEAECFKLPVQVELVDCTKRFAETVAVDGINLKIPAGTYCCCWDRADAARRQFCA
jgi:hypothetical protein